MLLGNSALAVNQNRPHLKQHLFFPYPICSFLPGSYCAGGGYTLFALLPSLNHRPF